MHSHAAGSKINDGVDRAISSSSSFMSASMLAKRGVLRYLSPVSGNIATMTEPAGAFFAVSTAAHTKMGVSIRHVTQNLRDEKLTRCPATDSGQNSFIPRQRLAHRDSCPVWYLNHLILKRLVQSLFENERDKVWSPTLMRFFQVRRKIRLHTIN